MWWIFWAVVAIGVLLVLAYIFVLPFGAPFLPTLKKQSSEALDLLDLKPGQVFVDLGCGEGRLLAIAASKGLRAVGYELNPFLVLYARGRTRRYGQRVKVKWSNFWRADLSDADGVFVFLVGHYMKRLDKLLNKHSKNHQIKLVSNAFKIPGKMPLRQKGALYLYVYPAPKT
ncbi:MAG TPA: methyltransferase domain-containing protein [Candidatus Saccharimonadales bacterium]